MSLFGANQEKVINQMLLRGKVSVFSIVFALVSLNTLAQEGTVESEIAQENVALSFERFDESEVQFGFVNEYCVACHNFEDWAGSLAFDSLSPNDVADNVDVWEHAITKLRGRFMPPANEPNRPTNQRADEFVAWMSDYLDHIENSNPYTGHVGLHRLNRKEYANAVRDLLGIEVDASVLLPVDSSVDGFDNVAEGLRVSPTFLEQSIAAARIVSVQAVGDPDARPGGSTYRPGNVGQQTVHLDGLPLGTRGGIAIEHYFPADGDYIINISDMASALWVTNQEFTHTLIATYDGEQFFELDVGGGEDLKAIDQGGDPAVDALNARLKNIPFTASAGPHEVVVAFKHRSFAEFEGRLRALNAGTGGANIIRVNSVEIQGPFNPTGLSETPARNKIFVCYPAIAAEEKNCARKILSTTARKAYRGDITDSDVNKLMKIYEQVRGSSSFDLSVRRGLSAILASPKFLYRREQAPAGAAPGSVYALNDLELATRLSFFLWSSIPDDELLGIAEAGNLSKEGEVERQVLRMLADPKAETLVSNFAYQWLNLAGLDEIIPDPSIFAGIDFGVRDLFKEEMNLFIGSIFLENRSVIELLSADYTFLNERLAQHYGDDSVRGDHFRRVPLNDSRRYGLLGKGAVLMVSAYPDRTSPVLRGNYVLEYITGTPPPEPPPNVEALLENKEGTVQMTVRERLETHRANPSCQGCHGIIDPLGFALENFDAVGRLRTRDYKIGGNLIDTSGVLPDGTPINGTDDLREALIAYPDNFAQFLTKQLMLFALGREINERDMPAVRNIVANAASNNYQFFDIVMGIIETQQFKQNETQALEDKRSPKLAQNN